MEAFFKDEDILVLNKEKTGDCAVFINESSYSDELNSIEDVQDFLREKYKQKVTNLIYGHEFYYIEKSEEFGPFTVEELAVKIEKDSIENQTQSFPIPKDMIKVVQKPVLVSKRHRTLRKIVNKKFKKS